MNFQKIFDDIVHGKSINTDFRPEKLSLKFIIIFIAIATVVAVFLDNPANSINLDIMTYENAIRINPRPLVIIFTGIYLGPFWGAITAGIIDLVSFRLWLSQHEFLFALTLASMFQGYLAGYIYNNHYTRFNLKNVAATVAVAYGLITIFISSFILYLELSVSLVDNIVTRAGLLSIAIPITIVIIYFILKYLKQQKDLYKMHKKLQKMVNTDGLTEVASRRAFMQHLDKMISHAQRSSKPLSLLSIDLDYFKEINDNYGHVIGDKALQEIGKILRNEVRKEDMAARLGGDEFAVLLIDTNLQGATKLAKRLNTRIENISLSGFNREITVSIGLTLLKPDDTKDSFLERCDEALYDAKDSGRNQIKTSK